MQDITTHSLLLIFVRSKRLVERTRVLYDMFSALLSGFHTTTEQKCMVCPHIKFYLTFVLYSLKVERVKIFLCLTPVPSNMTFHSAVFVFLTDREI